MCNINKSELITLSLNMLNYPMALTSLSTCQPGWVEGVILRPLGTWLLQLLEVMGGWLCEGGKQNQMLDSNKSL